MDALNINLSSSGGVDLTSGPTSSLYTVPVARLLQLSEIFLSTDSSTPVLAKVNSGTATLLEVLLSSAVPFNKALTALYLISGSALTIVWGTASGKKGTYFIRGIESDPSATAANKIGSSVFAPITNIYDSGSGNEIVPIGSGQLVAEYEGAGSSGRKNGASGTVYAGNGGAYGKKNIAIVPADWGKLIAWAVGGGGAAKTIVADGNAGGDSTVTTPALGTIPTAFTLVAHGGAAATQIIALAATATGGDTNTSGGTGTGGVVSGVYGYVGGAGAAPLGGAGGAYNAPGAAPGGGGGCGYNDGTADGINDRSGAGANGRVQFAWT